MSGTDNIQESQAQQLPKIFPQRLSENYKKIQNLLRPTRSTRNSGADNRANSGANNRANSGADNRANSGADNRANSTAHPVDDTLIGELEFLLNDSMPKTEAEQKQRVQEYLHFHRDPAGYYQHLNDAKLRFLVLWTDYKAITNHFRIRNVIHVRWTGDHYECQLFDKSKRIKQAARQNNYEASVADKRCIVDEDCIAGDYELTESSAVLNAAV